MKNESISIRPPKIEVAEFTVIGDTPMVQNKFSNKVKEEMRLKQELGSVSKKNKSKTAKNFQENYENAIHRSEEGWCGIPAPAFRSAMIRACSLAGFVMVTARMSIFIEPDGIDAEDGTPLVKITKGEPIYHESAVRIAMGTVDLRARPMWKPGWEAKLKVRYDADQFSLIDVANLLLRAGMQVGIGEGRIGSPKSNGMGWGSFTIKEGR
jgi:hypothetical protein